MNRATGLAVVGTAYYAPDILTFGEANNVTDAGLVLAEHANALLERAALAEADLAAAEGSVTGRARIGSFQSAAHRLALPAIDPDSHGTTVELLLHIVGLVS